MTPAILGGLIGVLAILGVPLFILIAMTTLLGALATDPGLVSNFFIDGVLELEKEALFVALPFFTFAGYLMSESNAPDRMVRVTRALLGWLPGGLAIVAVGTCAFFTAFTGASGVTIVALGGFLYPALASQNYDERFRLGLITTGGSLGLLFPPSLPLLMFGITSGIYLQGIPSAPKVEIQNLFLAALLPGILLVLVLSLYSYWVGRRVETDRQPFRWSETLRALGAASLEIPIPFLIVFLFFRGIITLSEIAVVTAVYLLIIEVFIYRDIPIRQIPKIIRQSMTLFGGILIILVVAIAFARFLDARKIPDEIFAFLQSRIDNRLTFLLALNCFLLIVGCLMDIYSAILVVVPLILPVALEYHVHPLHLGVIFLTNLEIGYSTPPVGINLFISSLRFNKPVLTLYRASIPFLFLLLVCLAIITYCPLLTEILVPAEALQWPLEKP